ncbi:MAG: hypothetical protein MRECE_9c027 [Mycoplasmataceae bacterium CE_OT135]|nr:MAG: hypothetical protein MRECE_9c027 [Mycoplasmataceae bacterium CE_OT135]
MTWNDYKTWLEENIIEIKTILETEVTVLREGIAEKYSLGNLSSREEALAKALENLCLSIEHNDDNSSYSDTAKEYHALPELKDLLNDNQAKKWEELFPDRATTFFGEKQKKKILDDTTWTALTRIFEDWRSEETRAKKLAQDLNEDEIAKEFLIKTAIHFNVDLLKKNGYEQKLVNWLSEYQKLGQEKQAELKEKKEQAEQLLKHLREEFKLHQEKVPDQNQSNHWDWKQIGKWSLIAGVILLGFALIRKLGKD